MITILFDKLEEHEKELIQLTKHEENGQGTRRLIRKILMRNSDNDDDVSSDKEI